MLQRVRLFAFYRLLRWLGIELIGGHFIYTRSLGANAQVIDAGANVGKFAGELLQRYRCHCIALEPVKHYAMQIPDLPGLKVVTAALWHEDGLVNFFISSRYDASSVFSEIADVDGTGNSVSVVQATSLMTLLADQKIEFVDLLKLDIEGAELQVLNGLLENGAERVAQISVEFHDFAIPEHRPKALELLHRFELDGWYVLRASRNGLMDVLMLNPYRISPGIIWRAFFRGFKQVEFGYA